MERLNSPPVVPARAGIQSFSPDLTIIPAHAGIQ